jgi:alkyl hydroperoxide reductase subunit AhpC
LLDFQKSLKEFEKRNIQVIALSSDPWEKAIETVERYKIAFRVGYGLDAREVSALTGAFYDEKEGYVHATGFIIDPEGRVVNAVYSTRSIGRLVAKDCLDYIGHS